MPYSGPGKRLDAVGGNGRTITHGKPAVWNTIPGIAFKTQQLDAFTDPSVAGATQIAATETFLLDVQGIHEVVRAGTLATADVGAAAVSHIYIHSTDDGLGLAADALSTGNLSANWFPFGVVIERDTSRSPQVLRVDMSLAYLCKVGTGG